MGRKRIKRNSSIVVWIRLQGRLCRLSPEERTANSCFFDLWNETVVDNTKPNQLLHGKLLSRSILDLPDECLVIIFSNLEHHEICIAAIVCKRFYQVSYNPILWKSIDLSFKALFSSGKFSVDIDDQWSQNNYMTNARRRELFVSYLSLRKAALRDIHASCIDIAMERDMMLTLINKCNVTHLTSLNLSWSRNWMFCSHAQEYALQSILELVARKGCNIKILKCCIGISLTTAQFLGRLQTIESLTLHFVCFYSVNNGVLHPEVLAMIFSCLPCLKYLRITISQSLPRDFHGYKLKSNSLEELVFGCTKGFLIRSVALPKLHTFKGENLYFTIHPNVRCLFKLIEKGCPLIQNLNNHTSLRPGLTNFNLTETEKANMFLCPCPDHFPTRVYS